MPDAPGEPRAAPAAPSPKAPTPVKAAPAPVEAPATVEAPAPVEAPTPVETHTRRGTHTRHQGTHTRQGTHDRRGGTHDRRGGTHDRRGGVKDPSPETSTPKAAATPPPGAPRVEDPAAAATPIGGGDVEMTDAPAPTPVSADLKSRLAEASSKKIGEKAMTARGWRSSTTSPRRIRRLTFSRTWLARRARFRTTSSAVSVRWRRLERRRRRARVSAARLAGPRLSSRRRPSRTWTGARRRCIASGWRGWRRQRGPALQPPPRDRDRARSGGADDAAGKDGSHRGEGVGERSDLGEERVRPPIGPRTTPRRLTTFRREWQR